MRLKKYHIELLLITLRVGEAIDLLLKCGDSHLKMIVRQKSEKLKEVLNSSMIRTASQKSEIMVISNSLLYILCNYEYLEIPYNLLAPNFNSQLMELVSMKERVEFALSKFTDTEILKEAKELEIRLINLESMILFDNTVFNKTVLLDKQSALAAKGKEFTDEFSVDLEITKITITYFWKTLKKHKGTAAKTSNFCSRIFFYPSLFTFCGK